MLKLFVTIIIIIIIQRFLGPLLLVSLWPFKHQKYSAHAGKGCFYFSHSGCRNFHHILGLEPELYNVRRGKDLKPSGMSTVNCKVRSNFDLLGSLIQCRRTAR